MLTKRQIAVCLAHVATASRNVNKCENVQDMLRKEKENTSRASYDAHTDNDILFKKKHILKFNIYHFQAAKFMRVYSYM